MKKRNFVLGFFTLCFLATGLISCGDDESCLTCTIGGMTEEVCDSNIDQFNRDSGLNAGTLGEIATLVQLSGGSCR